MDTLLTRLEQARERLQAKNQTRDQMLNEKRTITTKARTVITSVHQHETDKAKRTYKELLDEVENVKALLTDHPDLWASGALRNALTEVAEAWTVLTLAGQDAPYPTDRITDEAFMLGVGDAIGETHRLALDALIDDRVEEAHRRLEQMETLLEELLLLDVSGGLVDHRHKVDVGRRMVEKTRGKIALASIETRIQERFTKHHAGTEQPKEGP